MTDCARGTWVVRLSPRTMDGQAGVGPVGRMSIDQDLFEFAISETP